MRREKVLVLPVETMVEVIRGERRVVNVPHDAQVIHAAMYEPTRSIGLLLRCPAFKPYEGSLRPTMRAVTEKVKPKKKEEACVA